MTHLDLFLQKGPPDGDLSTGLDELRRVILLDGIPANSDGMVRLSSHTFPECDAHNPTVRVAYPRLAGPTERAPIMHRHISRSRPARSLTSLRQDPQRHLPHPHHRPALPPASHGKQPDARAERYSMETARRERGPRQWLDVPAYSRHTEESRWH